MVNATTAGKNIWVAASDGDIDRVRTLIDQGMSPNVKDINTYTPMHAAASYHHLEMLEYLISVGGDINLRDEDGDTPLYTVENVDTARWMVEHGADPTVQNNEGLTPAEALEDEAPEVAEYLRSLTASGASGQAVPTGPGAVDASGAAPVVLDQIANAQTSNLIADAQRIMAEAERDGTDPDERLRQIVEQAVRQGLNLGGLVGQQSRQEADVQLEEEDGRKRTRGD